MAPNAPDSFYLESSGAGTTPKLKTNVAKLGNILVALVGPVLHETVKKD
jgi:hypothetical protein